MTERYFAIFDDEVRRLKLVCMSEILPEPELIIMLSAYTAGGIAGKVQISASSQPEPMLKRLPIDAGKHIYLWRSPWCVYLDLAKAWIPILDSDNRNEIPGEYIYETEYAFYNPWYRPYKDLRATMLQNVEAIERELKGTQTEPIPIPRVATVPSAPPAYPQHKPPMFVASIIKRDAIANRMSCPISLEEFTQEMKTQVTPCFHIFESTHLAEWVSLKGSCPHCKAFIREEDCLVL